MRKKLGIISLIVALFVVFIIAKPKQSLGETTQVKRETITETIVQSGNITAAQESTILATSTGIIDKIMVTNGETVVAGQELVRIKSTGTDKDKAAAYAAYMSSVSALKAAEQSKGTNQVALENARKSVLDAVSAEKILNDNLGASKNNPATGKAYTQEEIDSIRSITIAARQNFSALEKRFNDTDTNIQSARAQVNATLSAYNATKDTVVKAPIDGTLANLNVAVGDNTTASSVQVSGTKIAHIINLDSYRLQIKVTERQIAKIMVGLPTRIVFDSIPDEQFTGNIVKVDSIGTEEQGLITYKVEIRVETPDARIKSGMSATVEIDVGEKQNTLVVPVSALRTDGENKFITVVQQGKQIDVPVRVGMRGTKYVEILEGVSDGTQVVIDTKK